MGLGPHVHRAFSAFSLIGMYGCVEKACICYVQ